MAKRDVVRTNLRVTQSRIDKAKRNLGTKTETNEQALDLVVFRQEVLEGINRIAGTDSMRDILAA